MKMMLKHSANTAAAVFMTAALFMTGMYVLSGSRLTKASVVIGGMMLFIVPAAVIMIREQYEEKHKGYVFLSVLPVTGIEVTGARFLLILAVDILFAVFLLVFFSFAGEAPGRPDIIRSFLLCCGLAGLIMAGVMLLGVLGLGYTRFMVIFLSFFVLLGFVPMFLMKVFDTGPKEAAAFLIDKVENFQAVPAAAAALLVYAGLFGLTAALKRE